MQRFKMRSRWAHMLSRCEDEDNPGYHNYGGRGIAVCREWHDFDVFYDWCLANGIDDGLQLDRIDNSKGYSPQNCRFVSQTENTRNRRITRYATADGETKPLAAWAEDGRCAISYTALIKRIDDGWPEELAVLAPPGHKRRVGPASNARKFDAFNESKTLNEWSKDYRCVVPQKTLSHRMHAGNWDMERALTQPLGPQHGRRYDRIEQ